LLGQLPLRALHALGSAIGTVGDWLPTRERHNARVNIELCFGEHPLGERKRLVRRSMQESAKGLLETAFIWHQPVSKVRRRIRDIDGAELFHEALADQRGLIIIAPHLGCWELLQMWVAQHGTSHALYRPPRQPDLEPLLNRGRARSGMQFWPARGSGIRALIKALRQGEIVGILPDQEPPQEGVFAPFFGVPAHTMTLLNRFAERSGARVLLGWAERLPRAGGYTLHWRRVEEAVDDPDPVTAATAMNRAIENAVRECPEQYQWSYRRFSKQPDGGRRLYSRWRSDNGWVKECKA